MLSLLSEDPPLPRPPVPASTLRNCPNCSQYAMFNVLDYAPFFGRLSCGECGWVLDDDGTLVKREMDQAENLRRLQLWSSPPKATRTNRKLSENDYRRAAFGSMTSTSKTAVGEYRRKLASEQERESKALLQRLQERGIGVATDTIRRALCLPADRPDEECMLSLPCRDGRPAGSAGRRRSVRTDAARSPRWPKGTGNAASMQGTPTDSPLSNRSASSSFSRANDDECRRDPRGARKSLGAIPSTQHGSNPSRSASPNILKGAAQAQSPNHDFQPSASRQSFVAASPLALNRDVSPRDRRHSVESMTRLRPHALTFDTQSSNSALEAAGAKHDVRAASKNAMCSAPLARSKSGGNARAMRPLEPASVSERRRGADAQRAQEQRSHNARPTTFSLPTPKQEAELQASRA